MPNNASRGLFLLLCVLVPAAKRLLGQTQYGCYTPWATRVVFDGTYQNGIYYPTYTANGQPGLAAVNGELILTWGGGTSNVLYSATSPDGVNWSSARVVSSSPQVYSSMYPAPPPYANGGVNMTTSTSCGYAYVAFADETGQNIYGARTQKGTSWDGPHLVWTLTPTVSAEGLPFNGGGEEYLWPPSPSDFSTSAPALYGGDSNVVRFAFPQLSSLNQVWQPGEENDSGGSNTYGYTVQVGQFDCDFSNVQVPPSSQQCFFLDRATGACLDSGNFGMNLEYDEGWVDYYKGESGFSVGTSWVPSGPWSPLWTSSVLSDGQVVELRALAQGNSLGNLNPPIWYST